MIIRSIFGFIVKKFFVTSLSLCITLHANADILGVATPEEIAETIRKTDEAYQNMTPEQKKKAQEMMDRSTEEAVKKVQEMKRKKEEKRKNNPSLLDEPDKQEQESSFFTDEQVKVGEQVWADGDDVLTHVTFPSYKSHQNAMEVLKLVSKEKNSKLYRDVNKFLNVEVPKRAMIEFCTYNLSGAYWGLEDSAAITLFNYLKKTQKNANETTLAIAATALTTTYHSQAKSLLFAMQLNNPNYLGASCTKLYKEINKNYKTFETFYQKVNDMDLESAINPKKKAINLDMANNFKPFNKFWLDDFSKQEKSNKALDNAILSGKKDTKKLEVMTYQVNYASFFNELEKYRKLAANAEGAEQERVDIIINHFLSRVAIGESLIGCGVDDLEKSLGHLYYKPTVNKENQIDFNLSKASYLIWLNAADFIRAHLALNGNDKNVCSKLKSNIEAIEGSIANYKNNIDKLDVNLLLMKEPRLSQSEAKTLQINPYDLTGDFKVDWKFDINKRKSTYERPEFFKEKGMKPFYHLQLN